MDIPDFTDITDSFTDIMGLGGRDDHNSIKSGVMKQKNL